MSARIAGQNFAADWNVATPGLLLNTSKQHLTARYTSFLNRSYQKCSHQSHADLLPLLPIATPSTTFVFAIIRANMLKTAQPDPAFWPGTENIICKTSFSPYHSSSLAQTQRDGGPTGRGRDSANR